MAQEFNYKDLAVIYEDNHIIVAVKPCNIPSQSDSSNDKDMMSLIAKVYYKALQPL